MSAETVPVPDEFMVSAAIVAATLTSFMRQFTVDVTVMLMLSADVASMRSSSSVWILRVMNFSKRQFLWLRKCVKPPSRMCWRPLFCVTAA